MVSVHEGLSGELRTNLEGHAALKITVQFWTGCSTWGCWWAAKPGGGVGDMSAGLFSSTVSLQVGMGWSLHADGVICEFPCPTRPSLSGCTGQCLHVQPSRDMLGWSNLPAQVGSGSQGAGWWVWDGSANFACCRVLRTLAPSCGWSATSPVSHGLLRCCGCIGLSCAGWSRGDAVVSLSAWGECCFCGIWPCVTQLKGRFKKLSQCVCVVGLSQEWGSWIQ